MTSDYFKTVSADSKVSSYVIMDHSWIIIILMSVSWIILFTELAIIFLRYFESLQSYNLFKCDWVFDVSVKLFPGMHQVIGKVETPQPYKFGYTIKDKESIQTRNEAGNGAGVVQGNYGFIDNKGIQRFVDYVADNKGFRAQIKTNEPGTTARNPAAVRMISNDPYSQGSVAPYISRGNVPYIPANQFSDPIRGLYTFKNFYQFDPKDAGFSGNQGDILYFGSDLIGGSYRGYSARVTTQ